MMNLQQNPEVEKLQKCIEARTESYERLANHPDFTLSKNALIEYWYAGSNEPKLPALRRGPNADGKFAVIGCLTAPHKSTHKCLYT